MRKGVRRISRWVSYAVAILCGTWLGLHIHEILTMATTLAE